MPASEPPCAHNAKAISAMEGSQSRQQLLTKFRLQAAAIRKNAEANSVAGDSQRTASYHKKAKFNWPTSQPPCAPNATASPPVLAPTVHNAVSATKHLSSNSVKEEDHGRNPAQTLPEQQALRVAVNDSLSSQASTSH
jgi:hypothetical protein